MQNTQRQLITACAFLYDSSQEEIRLFLPKRADTKRFLPGLYELPGGHIEYGEDMYDGLRREFEEEFHVQILIGDPFAAFTYTNDVKQSHSIEVVCFAKLTPTSPVIQLNPRDHSAHVWATKDMIADIAASRPNDDPEVRAMIRGFEILASGYAPKFH